MGHFMAEEAQTKPEAEEARPTEGREGEALPKGTEVKAAPAEPVEKEKKHKVKGGKGVHSGIAHILATFNNTVVTITDLNGKTISWSSAGRCGFRGSRKSTAYVAQLAAQDAARQAVGQGLREVLVKVKGPGTGRESAIRALQVVGLEVSLILDVTPVPHNGCRPRKSRRV
ncbi:30S ribosomal protein S11 [Methylacidimicrobium tartarophylax]|uniref:Small ribosomal subunit protein uS11 n=2 Tax=Methylacidimicrobium tartarophylax TaxID=1041768 RepID=A0A5E6MKP9_9BACT|nr:30S ribosomal protein S11 [Methylacidimicrobium tartarophylax]VVM06627.1 30S ribosomal protein S11 [Methylacidimicrobium tartarophylax]